MWKFLRRNEENFWKKPKIMSRKEMEIPTSTGNVESTDNTGFEGEEQMRVAADLERGSGKFGKGVISPRSQEF